ncbi:hypothetical protein AAFO90_23800 [Phaeobacter sp. CAU 1743]
MNHIEAETTPVKDPRVVATAKTLVAERMRDPEATRFKQNFQAYRTKQGDYIVCGTLNAKNAMGGYVGYKPFYVRMRNNQIEAFKLPSETDEYNIMLNNVRKTCSDAAAGMLMVGS